MRHFLEIGVSKTAIAKITGVSRTALYSFMTTRGLRPTDGEGDALARRHRGVAVSALPPHRSARAAGAGWPKGYSGRTARELRNHWR